MTTPTSTARRLYDLGRPERRSLGLAALAGAGAAACVVALMATSGWLIDRAAQHPSSVLALSVATASVRGFAIGRGSLRYLERIQSHDGAFRVLARVRVWIYRTLEPLVPGAIPHSGDVLGRMVEDADSVQNVWLRVVLPAAVLSASTGFSIGLSALILPEAGLILGLALVTAAVVSVGTAWRWSREQRLGTATLRGQLSTAMVDLALGAADLVANGAESSYAGRATRADTDLAEAGRRGARGAGIAGALRIAISGFGLVGVLAVAIAAHHQGRLPAVDLAALALLAMAAFDPIGPLAAGAASLDEDLEAARRFLSLGETAVPVLDPDDPLPPPRPRPDIWLRAARVGYRPGPPWALDGIDLHLPPGCRVALVGRSGSGKTTVANVLARFVELEQGSYTLDGVDAGLFLSDDVRTRVVLVPQDVHIFNTSLGHNLRIGNADASDDELQTTLRRVGLGRLLESLPEGLHSPLGEMGAFLSGGEQRRVAIARALLKDPGLLILDEPTSHLDGESAAAMMADIVASTGDRSLLVITHDRTGLSAMERIFELRDGRIVGERVPAAAG